MFLNSELRRVVGGVIVLAIHTILQRYIRAVIGKKQYFWLTVSASWCQHALLFQTNYCPRGSDGLYCFRSCTNMYLDNCTNL